MMNAKTITTQHQATFDGIRRSDDLGNEFWLARELARVLEYSQYRHLLPVLERAAEACRNSGQMAQDHMEDVLTMVDIGSGAQRAVEDVRLSRYACFLVVQNGDPTKSVIANGQTYFAPHKLKKSCAVMVCRAKARRIRRTLRWAARFARPSKIWVAPCRSNCHRPIRASGRLNRPGKGH